MILLSCNLCDRLFAAHPTNAVCIFHFSAKSQQWTPYFSLAGGLVTEIGGLLSHGAVVAREYELPCVVNVTSATDLFTTGSLIRLDASTGTVTVLG